MNMIRLMRVNQLSEDEVCSWSRYGVSLEFEGAGVVYKVDYNLVLTKIIDGVVMMNVVSIAVQYFAMYV